MKKRTLLRSFIIITFVLLLIIGGNVRAKEQISIYLPITFRDSCSGYVDDFSDLNSGWPISEDNDALYDYVNGEYRIVAKNPDSWVAASPEYKAENFNIEVHLYNASPIYGSYGIMFNVAEDWSHFYTYEIDTNGYFEIWRYSDSTGWKLLTSDYSPHIKFSLEVNQLRVKRENALIEVFANDHLLASLSDNSFIGKHYVGLIVSSFDIGNLDVRFDNFSITPCIS